MPLLRLVGTPERCRPFHLSSSSFYGRLQNLEDIANRDRDNASAQAIFLKVRYKNFPDADLQALSDRHPEYVVKRYESGGFATNAECDGIYRQALDRLAKGRGWRGSTSYSYRPDGMSTGSIFPAQASMPNPSRIPVPEDPGSFMAGMKGNPVHVVVDEGNPILYHC